MANWDDEDFEPAVTTTRGRFDDEEDDDDVLESWDAPSEDEKPKVLAPAKKKGTMKDALKRREEEEALQEAQRLANAQPDETPQQRKERMKAMELEADLNNAADLFGAAHITEADKTFLKSQTGGSTLSDILEPKPQTKEEFNQVVKLLVQGLITLGSSPNYADMVQELTKGLCDPISAEETRKVQASLNVLVNAKNLAEKGGPAKKKKAAGKPALAQMGAATSAYTKSMDMDDGIKKKSGAAKKAPSAAMARAMEDMVEDGYE